MPTMRPRKFRREGRCLLLSLGDLWMCLAFRHLRPLPQALSDNEEFWNRFDSKRKAGSFILGIHVGFRGGLGPADRSGTPALLLHERSASGSNGDLPALWNMLRIVVVPALVHLPVDHLLHFWPTLAHSSLVMLSFSIAIKVECHMGANEIETGSE